ncbi:hypothetical protein K9U34_04845 [Lawsonia intracellularis]|uniref:NA n=1 Tax=Lawsonia intracellularis (strain PHE/MN1-00) TaxID=363253 RepID=Q1MPI5_LAWIP|nr:hypothetical protein [Lawsonia intracellularis]AGC50471.1 hypothetical protein LAW_01076 [Lawsonia intracellularis N343]KAA0204490.1 hypothetical protein C4K43_05805 [Lawsonia intracellularis]MBZ3892919.1 hypothetical protein [Lawsonia intracellularis]OMQ02938.1 hypothetical protein BW722_05645 [Lawsonia intracellularis]RBN32925.1 hypothetical protein DR194_00575 [Lawsonia intracellularis]
MLTLPTVFIGSPIISDIDKPPFITTRQQTLTTPSNSSKYLHRICLSLITLGIYELIKVTCSIFNSKSKSSFFSMEKDEYSDYGYHILQPLSEEKTLLPNNIKRTMENIQNSFTATTNTAPLPLAKYGLEIPQTKTNLTKENIIKKLIQELKLIIIKEKILSDLHNELKNKNIYIDEIDKSYLLHTEHTKIVSLALNPDYTMSKEIKQLVYKLIKYIETKYNHIINYNN